LESKKEKTIRETSRGKQRIAKGGEGRGRDKRMGRSAKL
jgi:hypothetical protein